MSSIEQEDRGEREGHPWIFASRVEYLQRDRAAVVPMLERVESPLPSETQDAGMRGVRGWHECQALLVEAYSW